MIDLADAASLPQAFFSCAMDMARGDAAGEGRVLFHRRVRRGWESVTWDETAANVRRLAAALIRRGLEPGARVALMADNGPRWAVADLAIQAAGGVVVPVYCTSSESTIGHIVNDSAVAFFFAGTRHYLNRVAQLLEEGGSITAVLLDEEADGSTDALDLEAFCGPRGEEQDDARVDERMAALTRDDLATIIYTSGTTGPPKGVLLTHGNLLSNVEAGLRLLDIDEGAHLLSLLPMSHSFERTAGYYAPLLLGATIHFAQSAASLTRDIAAARPNVVMVVPRILEKMRQKVLAGIEAMTGFKGALARWALGVRLRVGRQIFAGESVGPLLGLAARLALKVIGPPIAEKFGGRLQCFFAGGAALSGEVWAFYHAVGVTIVPGYGLTETSPIISANTIDRLKPASVGLILDNMEIRIAGDGEILARGPSIMKGYHNLPEATAEVIDEEGFLHTGDVGHVDDDGFLFITDRKKDIIVSAAGKNISPQNVENTLCEGPYIEYACVFGEGQNVLGAILSPEMEAVQEYAAEHGIDAEDVAALVGHTEIAALFKAEVDRANASLAAYERIARHHVVGVPFSTEGGEITITLKVRRKILAEMYAAEIEGFFRRD